MSAHIALLRGINVGGHNLVAMPALHQMFQDLGFTEVKTLLQSGNVVFRSEQLTGGALEKLLEAETADRLHVSVDYVIRTEKEWRTLIARNPFPDEALHDPSHLIVMFLKTAPTSDQVHELEQTIRGREVIRAVGKQLFVVYPDGMGKSKFTSNLIEKKLRTRGTARNWNTVQKLAAAITM